MITILRIMYILSIIIVAAWILLAGGALVWVVAKMIREVTNEDRAD